MKNSIKTVVILACMMAGIQDSSAQQLGYTSQMNNTHFIWNPAMTAPTTHMRVGAFFRQQWISFENAPRTAFASLEYPLVDSNMSIGGALINDKTGPTGRNGIHLSYSYKIEELLNRDDQLSIGISGSFNQFSFDPANEIFNDANDALLAMSRSTSIYPTVGLGMFYTNNNESWDGNAFYFGLSGSQVYATDILVNTGNFNRTMHFFANVGTKLYYNYEYMFQPSININIANEELVSMLINVNFEMEETFWAGIGYSTASEMAFQGGVILSDVLARYSELRIGVLGNLPVTNKLKQFGPGFEFFVNYNFDLD